MNPGTNWVKKLIEQRNINAANLAQMAGLAPSTIYSAINTNRTKSLSNDTIRKIAKALDVEIPYGILADEGSNEEEGKISKKLTLPEGRVYVTIPTDLSEESRKKVEALLMSLIKKID